MYTCLQTVVFMIDSPWPVEEAAPILVAYPPQPGNGVSPTRPIHFPGMPPEEGEARQSRSQANVGFKGNFITWSVQNEILFWGGMNYLLTIWNINMKYRSICHHERSTVLVHLFICLSSFFSVAVQFCIVPVKVPLLKLQVFTSWQAYSYRIRGPASYSALFMLHFKIYEPVTFDTIKELRIINCE